MSHALLVVGPKGRESAAFRMERLAHRGDIAVAEDRPDAGEERQRLSVDLRPLRSEGTDQSLRHGETDRGHGGPPVAGAGPVVLLSSWFRARERAPSSGL
jgi:hypothetical protein